MIRDIAYEVVNLGTFGAIFYAGWRIDWIIAAIEWAAS
jgi:hypothetical protein